MKLTPELIRASGSVYFDGYRTAEEFAQIHGFDPGKYPQAFQLTRSGLVLTTQGYADACKRHFAQARCDGAALGLRYA